MSGNQGVSVDPAQRVLAVLREVVNRSNRLDYAVFLPRDRASGKDWQTPPPRNSWVCVARHTLEGVLHRYGLNHARDEQLDSWNAVLPEVHESFWQLEAARRESAKAGPSRATRLVLDIDMGGLLYAAVGEHGWVFAATLHQQAMNNGRAERELTEIVHRLGAILERT